jgi:hypothetical protein
MNDIISVFIIYTPLETCIKFNIVLKNSKDLSGGITQGVDRLPSKLEALSSNPSTAKKKVSGVGHGLSDTVLT